MHCKCYKTIKELPLHLGEPYGTFVAVATVVAVVAVVADETLKTLEDG